VGITGEIMLSLQSFECTWRTKSSLHAAHSPTQSRVEGLGETPFWWRVMKSSGYYRKLSIFHIFRTLPWFNSSPSTNQVTGQFFNWHKSKFYHKPYLLSRKAVNKMKGHLA